MSVGRVVDEAAAEETIRIQYFCGDDDMQFLWLYLKEEAVEEQKGKI